MNAYGILAGLAIMALLAGWGSWESGKVDKLQGQLDSLKASYATAAANAKLDAQKQEAADLDALNKQSVATLASEEKQKTAIQSQLTVYQKRVKEASGAEDLPHRCAGIPIAPDLIPGP